MRRQAILASLAVVMLGCFFVLEAHAQRCSEATSQSSGKHYFRRVGESIEIPIAPRTAATSETENEAASIECYPLSLELHWTNGRNNGGNFQLQVFDSRNQVIYGREIAGFLVGTHQLPLTGIEAQQWLGRHLISVPAKITITAKPPLAPPASLSYSITWLESSARTGSNRAENGSNESENSPAKPDRTTAKRVEPARGNEILRVRSVVRLVGSSRLPLVQIELKSAVPFPVREIPLQVRIGHQAFLNEVAGEYTGRLLTLSLTPKMFADLKDGAEIIAFYDETEFWSFGKLAKSRLDN